MLSHETFSKKFRKIFASASISSIVLGFLSSKMKILLNFSFSIRKWPFSGNPISDSNLFQFRCKYRHYSQSHPLLLELCGHEHVELFVLLQGHSV